jgi:hypothetical protein
MRTIGPTLAVAMLLGLTSVPPAFAQRNLPSDVEQQLGIPPNAANRERRYRNPPSDWEQQQRRRAYRYEPYDDDYNDRRRYQPVYRYYYR